MASLIFDAFWDNVAKGNIDIDSDTFYVMLTTSGYTENKGTHQYRSDVTSEVTGTGYTAGGASVTVTVAKDTTNHKETITLGSASWSSSTITARKAVYYKHRGGASTADEIVAVVDFGSDVVSSSGTFTLNSSTITLQN